MIHQVDRKRAVASYASFSKFYGNCQLVFVLAQEIVFHIVFVLKRKIKFLGSFKKTVLGIFKMTLKLFLTEGFKYFNTLTLKQVFRKTKTYFLKLEHRLLVYSTTTESAAFKPPWQTPMLRQIVWGVQNGPI